MIKVITYNLLSPNLCYPDEFKDYDSSYLDGNSRKNKIVLLIDEWTSQENPPIICFQEVAASWKGTLEKIFFNRSYHFFTMSYGYKRNGFFGVSIAVPYSYQVDKIEYIPISDHIVAVTPSEEPQQIPNLFGKIFSFLDMTPPPKTKEELIQEAKKRPNLTIKITLKKEDTSFILYNYHMPCAFRTPIVQTLHLDALKKLFYQHPNIPTIFAADLNLTPDSIGYNYLTTSQLPPDHAEYFPERDHYKLALQSAYKQFNDQEPQFTCHSDTLWGGLFKNTLDYIFVSHHFKTISSKLLMFSEEKMPNKLSPSDHLPVQAELIIKGDTLTLD